MTRLDGLRNRLVQLRDAAEPWFAKVRGPLTQTHSIGVLDKLNANVRALSSGDRAIVYLLVGIVCIASLSSVYALEQRLLIVQPTYGGSLTEGEVGSPRFINPLLATSNADRDLTALTYAGLMGLSSTGALEPVLAESYTVSEDGKTYTFILRKDVRFSDGGAVTAQDVAFTIQKAQDSAIKSPQFASWSGVTATVIDDRTISFTLLKPYAPFLELTTLGILPMKLWQGIADDQFAFSNLQTNPIGAGPFKIQSVSRDATGLIESVSLTANSRYALGRPYLDNINFQFYSRAEDLANALESGATDSAYDLPAGKTSAQTLTAPYARVFGVFFNQNDNQVYTRLEVRKALSLVVDRENIVSNVLGGYATAIMGPVPPDGTITQVPVPASDNRVAMATKVLTDAGWVYDGSAHAWTNTKAKQTLSTITIRTSNVPELKNVASAVKTDWEKLGIPVTIELYEPGDLSQNIIRPRKYSALLYGMVIGRDQDLYAFWDSQERNDPGLNIAMYASKTVDKLLEDARSSSDPKTRTSNLQKIENLIAADYPAAFIYAPDFTYAVPSDLRGVELPQIVTPEDRFASVARWYRVTDAVWPIFVNGEVATSQE